MKVDTHHSPARFRGGITSIEHLILLSIIAIILSISVPGSAIMLSYYQIGEASDQLAESLNTARQESRLRHSTVRICPSVNSRFCGGDDWS